MLFCLARGYYKGTKKVEDMDKKRGESVKECIAAQAQYEEKMGQLKGEVMDVNFGSQIRSYVFHPYKMVKDHRTSYETANVEAVRNGEIDGFIESYLRNYDAYAVFYDKTGKLLNEKPTKMQNFMQKG